MSTRKRTGTNSISFNEKYRPKENRNPDMAPSNSRQTLNHVYFPGQDLEDLTDNSPQFTLRSIIVGCLLGTLISASNFFVGFKMGWTFGAGIFGSIFGFSIVNFFRHFYIGGKFSAKEHATLCSIATASGCGTLAGYISGIPAMYRLGLLKDVDTDLPRIALWSIAASLYGMFFAIPLRKWFIIKQKLPFPSPTATAEIIKSLHGAGGVATASLKTKSMLHTMSFSIIFLIIAYFIPVLKDLRVFYWLAHLFPNNTKAYYDLIEANRWNWSIKISAAFLGAGMMTPMTTHLSTNFGSILAWAIIGPLISSYGIAPGDRFQMRGTMVDGRLVTVTEMPSARYWLLWPGLFMILVASFAELGCKGGNFFKAIKNLFGMLRLRGKENLSQDVKVHKHDLDDSTLNEDDEEDLVPKHELIPASWWISGLAFSIILSIIVLGQGFGVSVGESLLAIILGFIFAFIGLQSAGETDMNPSGTIAKASQIVLSFLPPYNPTGEALMAKQLSSLNAGLVSASAAHQAVEMVSDLKTGHLIGASPRSQFLGQTVGSLVGAAIGLGFWKLFTTAYPCIVSTSLEADKICSDAGFGLQAVSAWQGITVALTKSNAIPQSALITGAFFGIATAIIVYFKHFHIPKKYHHFVPSMSGVGIAFINTDPSIFIATLTGGLISFFWKRRDLKSFEFYMYAVASGLIAGEGIYGLIQAGFTVSMIKEGSWTRWGMPPH